MKLKNIFLRLIAITFLLIHILSPSFVFAMDGDDGMPDIEDLDLDIDLLEESAPKGSRGIINNGAAASLGVFLDDIELNEPLWTTTKPEKGRDILYLMPSKITAIEYGGASCNLFFNMTSKMNLTGSNLLNIDQINPDGIITWAPLLTTGIKNAGQIGALLPFAKKITIQERKLGTYFQTGFSRGAFLLQCHTSLQIGERNFWLNKHDLAEIQALNSLIFGDDQAYDETNLYRIRVGMGDTRIKLGLNTVNSKILQTDVGIECIIPTSRSSRKFLTEVDVDSQLTDDKTAYNAVINALLNVRDYLLTPEIGNGGHFGLGFYFESKCNLFRNLAELITRVSFDKFFEADEQRLMLHKQSGINATKLQGGFGSDADAQAAVVKFAKEFLIPVPYKVSTEPGGIFNGIMILNIPYKKWNFRYGYDFYFQQAERFKKVYADQATLPLLSVDLARVGTVTQHKISSETTYRIKNFNNINLDIGFGGDTTIAAHNIGKDWTIYLKFASEF